MIRYDIIVAGAGTAGVFAALSAAKQGMNVLLLEKTTACGGIGTNGAIAPYYDRSFIDLSADIDKDVFDRQDGSGFLLPLKRNCVSTELLKGAYEQELLKNGVEIIYRAVVSGVLSDGNRVIGLKWHDPQGNHEAGAGVVIDATADGTVLALAGAEFLEDGIRQPYARIYSYLAGDSLWNFGGDAGYVNQDDPENLSLELLKSAAAQVPEQFSEVEKRFLTAPVPGLREGRHLRGRETVRFSDIVHNKQTGNPVAREYANFDTHTIDLVFEDEEFYLFCVAALQWETHFNITIPFGALLPVGMEGIIAAGRMISADHEASQGVRMKGCMKHLGAIAGAAAAISVKKKISLSKVSSQEITALYPLPERAELLKQNTDLWLSDPVEIKEKLKKSNPGTAIWSAYLNGVTEPLYELLDESGFARVHGAFALALQHDKKALKVLRELVEREDQTRSETLRNEPVREPHGAIAAYLLGRLNDKESFPLLCRLFENCRDFFFVSAAWHSLLRLTENNSELRRSGYEILKSFAEGQRKIPPFRCYCGEICDATEKMKSITLKHLKNITL